MFGARSNSISRKLTWMNMLASGAALLLACIALFAYDLATFRKTMARQLSIQAQIIGSNSVSALLFNDARSAEKTLSALKASPNILSAGVYTPDGRPFAAYWREASEQILPLPALPAGQAQSHWFGDGQLAMVSSILFKGEPAGTVYIRSDLREMVDRLKRYSAIIAVVSVASLLAALSVSRMSQRAISTPVIHLVEIARVVSREKRYSIRATPSDNRDEVAVLIDAFNEMLAQIQERDAALQAAHNELEQRVQARTAELAAANKELEAFSYSVSHDLRAPLRSIDGFSHALLEDCAERLDSQGKSHLHRIRAATQRMGQLIDDLLNLSRVTRTEMQTEKLDVSALARSIAAELRRTQPDRRVDVRIEDGLETTGDRRLLRVVLENLLSNAWKFTAKHESARVEVGKMQINGTPAYFVRDDGAGFDPAYAERLFGPFQRLHAAAEFPGTGVGLATVQRIIQRHGGRIWAAAAVEQGATFYFTLAETIS